MATITTDSAQEQRAAAMTNAIASVRLEGLEPSREATAIFQCYVDGELSAGEMGDAIDALLDNEYGPLRLPGNQCTEES
jgi:hypothetical protein